MQNKFLIAINRIILFILVMVSGYLTLAGMFSTVYLTDTEHVYFCADNPVIHIVTAAVVLAACVFVKIKCPKCVKSDAENACTGCKGNINSGSSKIPVFILVVYFLILTYIVLSTCLVPTFDQLHVSEAAIAILHNDFSSFLPGGYARLWDNQSGFILYLAGIYAIFGEGNVIAVQLLNAIYSTITLGMIYALAKRLVPKMATTVLTAAALFMPMWFFTTFVYGTAPSLMLSVIAMVLEADYFADISRTGVGTGKIGTGDVAASQFVNTETRENTLLFGGGNGTLLRPLSHPTQLILAAAAIALATVLKTNALIFLLAMVVYAFIEGVGGVRNKAILKSALAILLIFAFYALAGKIVSLTIHNLTGMDDLSGTPRTAHIAMGLQESSNKSSGWFNGYNQAVFEENNYDHDAANAAAVANIKDSLNRFRTSPSNAVGFFLKKIVSQWCEPTCESLFVLMSRNSNITPAGWLGSATVGGVGSKLLINIMNIGQSLIYTGTFFWAVWAFINAKKIRPVMIFPAIVFLGGFFFHLFWEANSQYTLVYIILIIGYVPCGFWAAAEQMAQIGITSEAGRITKLALRPGSLVRCAALPATAAIICIIAMAPDESPIGRAFKMNWGTGEYETYRCSVCAQKIEKAPGLSDGRYLVCTNEQANPGDEDSRINKNYETLVIDEETGYAICSECEDLNAAQWFVTYTSCGYVLRYQNSQKVLDIECASTEAGTRAQQWDYNGDISQLFEIRSIKDNEYAIIYSGNMALTRDAASGNITIQEYVGDTTQLWRFEKVGQGT